MPDRYKWGGMAIAVVAGLLIGFALTTIAYRHHLLIVPGGTVVERMDRELQLTPAQHAQIADIMKNTRIQAQQMRQDYHKQRHELFMQARERIRGVLSTEQQQKFDRDFPPMGHHHERDHGD